MKVEDVMTKEVQCCLPEAKLSEAAQKMSDRDCGVVPVVDARGRIQGILTDRDIALTLGRLTHRPSSEVAVREAMTRKVHACAPADELSSALRKMRSEGVNRLPVVAPSGEIAGILSIHDILFRIGPGRGGEVGISNDDLVATVRGIWCEQKAARMVQGTESSRK